ncbi:hypothetical protein MRB53_033065 [Persea americana]|uniref:Uncharacterized protein n=1 Tax=Persea americana TaxID=3435 RepID=A0ACC2KTY6_PERAE|nr:hypothetical protein MRB53_033065 [Persea americana]
MLKVSSSPLPFHLRNGLKASSTSKSLTTWFNSKDYLLSTVSQSPFLMDGHLTGKCPFVLKRGILKEHGNVRDGAPTIAILGEPGQLHTSVDSSEVPIFTEDTIVNTEKEGDQGLSTDSSLLEVVDPKLSLPKPIPSASTDNSTMAILESNEGNPVLSLLRDIIHNILEKISAPVVDLSNPFLVLEHSSVIEPVFSYSLSKNIPEASKNVSDPSLGPPPQAQTPFLAPPP